MALFKNENRVVFSLAVVIWLTAVVLVVIEELLNQSLGWLGAASVFVVVLGILYFAYVVIAAIARCK